MNKELTIKNFTFKNIFNLGGPLMFVFFVGWCAFNVGLGEGVLRNLLVFLYTSGTILAMGLMNYFSTVVTVNQRGILKNSLYFSHYIEWKNIKSLNVQLVTKDKYVKTLDKKEYFDEFYIGKKEILISDIENQLDQSKLTRWRKIIRLPFNHSTIEILKHNKLL
ncbi:hypothetical protein [Flavobacterium sp. LC2016-01]|uniref:hypothetical protein n=1 Tax=Flavobacterium sp. LC2016-01 TaxID=2675876 RepID=UPI0012BB0602|nr:hypothetical protein [Flavobacterium sp. LC2016-01]MTH16388.1 hypothetical protein [Flavobacterium sp. LC2016-01]